MGYSVLQDAILLNLPKADMINKYGTIVTASSDSVAFAVMEKGGSLNNLLNAVLADGASSRVWPIAGYTYFVLRLKSHIGSCEQRKHAMRYLYNFYNSDTVLQIASRLGFATLPNFIQAIVVNVLLNGALCNSGEYALAEYRKTTTPVFSTATISSTVQTYLSAFYNLDSSTAFSITTDPTSVNVWNNFAQSPSSSVGAFLSFPSRAAKLSAYKQAKIPLIVAAFAHVALVPVYHLNAYTSKTSTPLQLTPAILAGIYTGKILYWNDSSIQAANNAYKSYLPHSRIIATVRAGSSDANAVFSRFLSLYSSSFKSAYGLAGLPDGNYTLKFATVIPGNNTLYASDNAHVDAIVTYNDHSIGYFLQTSTPGSNVASLCYDPNCVNPVAPVAANLQSCESDPNAQVVASAGLSAVNTYDLMISNASSCYKMATTVELAVPSGVDSSCSAGSTGIAYIRVHFASWLYSSSALTQPLASVGASGPLDSLRFATFKNICNIKCAGEYLGYVYCDYVDCSWKNGDYNQIVSSCSPATSKRTVTYVLHTGDQCIPNPVTIPNSPVKIACDSVPSNSVIGIVMYVIIAIGVVFSIIMLTVAYQKRTDRKMVKSHPMFVYIFVLGSVLLNLSSVAFVGENTDFSCAIRPWVYNLTLTFMFAPIVMKLYTVDKLYHNPKLKKIYVSDTRVVKEVAWLLAVDMVILIVWTILETPKAQHYSNSYSGVQADVEDRQCNTGLNQIMYIVMLVYKSCLFLFGIMKAICTWHVTTEVSEAKQFAVAIAIGTMSYLVNVFLSFSSSSAVVVQVVGTFLCANLSVLLIMIPKFAKKKVIPNGVHIPHPSMLAEAKEEKPGEKPLPGILSGHGGPKRTQQTYNGNSSNQMLSRHSMETSGHKKTENNVEIFDSKKELVAGLDPAAKSGELFIKRAESPFSNIA